ncbi:MAG: SDR family oxidoreductase [Deltaproteobacteria bacterium]|jgi:NAD(P)-dependent dehydrogenase (short-subunit alcohol dehydrogenase family)|nr:SDR family oxidoreductase [Deltaproteobacteria bacterium]
MDYFKDKVTIVTGGASGLGRALCMELGRRGAIVIPVDINQEGAQKVAADIIDAGGEAIFAYLDVTLFENAQKIVNEINSKYGRLDLIFNNAGTAIQGETRDLALHHWRNVIEVNLLGVIHGAISAYGIMEKQGGGQIINISSLGGLIPLPKEIPYCTSKWAIVGFSNSLRVEGADLGIKVNLVCPGIMQTPIHESISVVNVEKDKLALPVPKKYHVDPAKAADIILKGVERNKPFIIFPFYARFIWWLYRFNPNMFLFLFRKTIRDFRKIRIDR